MGKVAAQSSESVEGESPEALLHAFAAAAAELDHLGEPDQPLQVRRGPACPQGWVTLSYLQQLLPTR